MIRSHAGKEVDSRAAATFRAARSTYLVALVVAVTPAMLAPICLKHSQYGSAVVLLLFVVLPFVWVSRFALTITQDRVIYRSLDAGTRVVLLEHVAAAKWKFGYGPGDSRLLPPNRIEIERIGGQSRLVINAKVFSYEAVLALMAALDGAPAVSGRRT
jgi:hypothetical protein